MITAVNGLHGFVALGLEIEEFFCDSAFTGTPLCHLCVANRPNSDIQNIHLSSPDHWITLLAHQS